MPLRFGPLKIGSRGHSAAAIQPLILAAETGPRRPGARDRRDRVIFRRLRLDRADRRSGRAADQARAGVRTG